MNEDKVSTGSDGAASVPLRVHSSAGVLLREARESQGWSVEALAAVLKVPVGKLEALELDRIDQLPDVFFARALASSVCRTLKVDASEVLQLLPATTLAPMKTDEAGINTPFRVPGERAGLGGLFSLKKPMAIAVFLLLLGALAMFFLPSISIPSFSNDSPSDSGVVMSAPIAVQPAIPAPSGADPATPVPDGAPALPLVDQSPVSQSADVAERIAASPLPVTVAGSGSASGDVVLKAQGATWVEVVDAKGGVQIRKIMEAGEIVGVSGQRPLAVVIGRSDVLVVEVQGKPVDLAPLSKNNIARFEVK